MGSVLDNRVVELNPKIINVYRFPAIATRWAIASLTRIRTNYFRQGTVGEEGVMMPLATPVVALNIREELPVETNNQTANTYRFPLLAARRAIASLTRMRTDRFPQRALGEEAVMMPGCLLPTSVVALNIVEEAVLTSSSVLGTQVVALNMVEEPHAETNNQAAKAYRAPLIAASQPISYLKRLWADYFPRGTSGEEGVVMPESVLANRVVELNICEELPAETNNQTANAYRSALVAARRSISYLKRMWADYFPRGTLGEEGAVMPRSVLANPVVQLNSSEELPGETNNENRCLVLAAKRRIESLCLLWTRYFPRRTLGEEGVTKPRFAFKLVIVSLLSFAAIKSQGTRFPFKTHPLMSMVSVTSLLLYGLASKAGDLISAAPPGPDSVYAFTARLGGKFCLLIWNHGVEKP